MEILVSCKTLICKYQSARRYIFDVGASGSPEILVFMYETTQRYILQDSNLLIQGRVGGRRPPLWSSVQSSWLHIQRSGFDSRSYQIFGEVASLERGPLSLVSTL
jgi:hypothetical protein